MAAASTFDRHAAAADVAARAADVHAGQLGHRRDLGDELGAGAAGLAGVEPVHVGEQHERVGVDDVRHQGGQPVVVAEADLVRGHGVVLVDDRHHVERQQPFQRALGVAVVAAPVQVVGGEQHLPDVQAVAPERGGVALGEQQLPDACRGLLGGEVTRAGAQSQRPDAGRDRAGRHEHHLLPRGHARRDGVDDRVQPFRGEPPARGQRRRPDLHDGAPCRSHRLPGHRPALASLGSPGRALLRSRFAPQASLTRPRPRRPSCRCAVTSSPRGVRTRGCGSSGRAGRRCRGGSASTPRRPRRRSVRSRR